MLLQSGAVKIKVLLTPFISQTEKRLKVCNVSDSDQLIITKGDVLYASSIQDITNSQFRSFFPHV